MFDIAVDIDVVFDDTVDVDIVFDDAVDIDVDVVVDVYVAHSTLHFIHVLDCQSVFMNFQCFFPHLCNWTATRGTYYTPQVSQSNTLPLIMV